MSTPKPRRQMETKSSGVHHRSATLTHTLDFSIQPQPTETTCGPTCLQAVYHYWNDSISLEQTIHEVGQLSQGGTLAVQLGCHALRRGYQATIATYNLQLFDPSWFGDPPVDLSSKLIQQQAARMDAGRGDAAEVERLQFATRSYLEFLELGGLVEMPPFNEGLIATSLEQGWPILCGLSATYLYRECRERMHAGSNANLRSEPDDVGGQPVGHFVVLHGFDPMTRDLLVADPLFPNPLAASHNYRAPVADVITAILLGIVTYDANLLTIRPSPEQQADPIPQADEGPQPDGGPQPGGGPQAGPHGPRSRSDSIEQHPSTKAGPAEVPAPPPRSAGDA